MFVIGSQCLNNDLTATEVFQLNLPQNDDKIE